MSVQTEILPISMLSRQERHRDTVRRILWIVNHKTLMTGEVPLLRSLGFEVFIPKVVPIHDRAFRSAGVTHDYDAALDLAPAALRVLNHENFFERCWATDGHPNYKPILRRYSLPLYVLHYPPSGGGIEIPGPPHRTRVRSGTPSNVWRIPNVGATPFLVGGHSFAGAKIHFRTSI